MSEVDPKKTTQLSQLSSYKKYVYNGYKRWVQEQQLCQDLQIPHWTTQPKEKLHLWNINKLH